MIYHISQLPTETLLQIISYLPEKQSLGLSLVNSKFRDLTVSQVFHTIFVKLSPKSFRNIHQLCSSEKAKYVQRIVYLAPFFAVNLRVNFHPSVL
jgi:hypothetical protein